MDRPPWNYGVFLCFRGKDTRHGFTRDLRAALHPRDRTFLDDEIRKGQELGPVLAQAIQESAIAVVIVSRDFASSTWCLNEVVKIIECHETRGQVVVPVFYDVNPSEVREQTGNFSEAFARHSKVNSEKVRKWRAALTQVASIQPAWDSRVIGPEQMLVDDIVQYITTTLKRKMDEWEETYFTTSSISTALLQSGPTEAEGCSTFQNLLGSGHHPGPSIFSTPGHSNFARFGAFGP